MSPIILFFAMFPLAGLCGLGVWLWKRRKAQREKADFHQAFGTDAREKPNVHNPYIEARKEFNDRYGDLARGKRNWQIAALFLVVTVCVLGTALSVVAMQHQVQPYILEVDEHGAYRGVGAMPSATPDELMVKRHLQEWVRHARMVVSDYRAQDQYLELAYASVQGQARTALSEWHESHPAKERSRTETVLVQPKEPFVLTDTTYQLRWTEVSYNRVGTSRSTEHDAIVEVGIVPPNNDAELARNPLGIRIVHLDW